MNDFDDVFDSEISTSHCERIVAERDYQRATEKITKLSYSEGYFETCDREIKEKYDEGFVKGKKYSLDYGEILGKLE
jgi:hypothetical protein